MLDMRYLEHLDHYFPNSYRVFEEYFRDEDDFRGFFNAIKSDEDKNKFLYLSSLYYYVVKSGNFTTEDNNYVGYFDIAYKYITVVSIIEDLSLGDEYQNFYQWVKSNNNVDGLLPIDSLQKLKSLHWKYKNNTGAVTNFSRFFEMLDENTQNYIIGSFRGINKENISYREIVKGLYDVRSKFVHEAKCVLILSSNLHIMQLGYKRAASKFSFSDFQIVFERGFLIFYGYNKKKFERLVNESFFARRRTR